MTESPTNASLFISSLILSNYLVVGYFSERAITSIFTINYVLNFLPESLKFWYSVIKTGIFKFSIIGSIYSINF